MWAPLTPPATYTPKATARAHPQAISSQSPLAAKISVPRPDWFRAATAMATTPSPKAIRTRVPRNSASSSPHTVARRRAVARAIAHHLSGGRAAGPCLAYDSYRSTRYLTPEHHPRLSCCHVRTGPAGLRAAARLPNRAATVPVLERAAGRGGRGHPGPAPAAAGHPRAPRPPRPHHRRDRRLPAGPPSQRGRADRPGGGGGPGHPAGRQRGRPHGPDRPHRRRPPAAGAAGRRPPRGAGPDDLPAPHALGRPGDRRLTRALSIVLRYHRPARGEEAVWPVPMRRPWPAPCTTCRAGS